MVILVQCYQKKLYLRAFNAADREGTRTMSGQISYGNLTHIVSVGMAGIVCLSDSVREDGLFCPMCI